MSGASRGAKDRGRRGWAVTRVRFGTLTGAIAVVNNDDGARRARRYRSVTRSVIVAAS
jgi:hypothetical protein